MGSDMVPSSHAGMTCSNCEMERRTCEDYYPRGAPGRGRLMERHWVSPLERGGDLDAAGFLFYGPNETEITI